MGQRRNSLSSPEWTLLKAVLDLLKNDAQVSTAFKRAYTWEGEYDDPEDPIPEAQLPAYRVALEDAPSEWLSQREYGETLSIRIDVYSPGWHVADLLGLMHVVRAVFLKRSNYPTLQNAGAREWAVRRGPAPELRGRPAERYLVGSVLLDVVISVAET